MTGWREVQRQSGPVTAAFWFNAGLAVFALVAMPFDHRVILGLNPWIKPLKFDLSTMIYAATVAVLLREVAADPERMRRWRALVGWVVGVAMIVENAIISLQSLRGVRSHMNYTTVLDGMLFGVMGLWIALNTAAVALLLGLWLVSRPPGVPRAVQWGVRLGLLVFLAGSFEGVLMVAHGGHTVGAPDGGPGLPFVNWSTGHGDLRIAHFLALHALQLMPLIGLAVTRLRVSSRLQVGVVCGVCTGYVGVVWGLFRQAMSGRSLWG